MFSQMLIWPVGFSATDVTGPATPDKCEAAATRPSDDALRRLALRAKRAILGRICYSQGGESALR